MKIFVIIYALLLMTTLTCWGATHATEECVVVGVERLAEYRYLLEGRRVGVLANHTSRTAHTHTVDTLLASGVDVTLIFTPEGGFRGDGVERRRDAYLGIEIVELTQQPKSNDVFRCDLIVCDLQDEGVRCSQAIVALRRLMQTCADVGVPMLILDRPNPNGSRVDGAIIEEPLRRAGEDLPLPLVYGMTLGEVARMINGEGWLTGGVKCPLTVVPCLNYNRLNNESSEVLSQGLCVEVPIVVGGEIDLSQVVKAYAERHSDEPFFIGEEFDIMIGASYVRDMVEMGYTAEETEAMWRGDVERFGEQRAKYLIYEN